MLPSVRPPVIEKTYLDGEPAPGRRFLDSRRRQRRIDHRAGPAPAGRLPADTEEPATPGQPPITGRIGTQAGVTAVAGSSALSISRSAIWS
jgi:hypothetical protein